jgi:hypothetical protein
MKLIRIAVIAAVLATGCSTTSERRLEVIREGRALLNHPAPGDPEWDARHRIFDANADAEEGE